MRLGAVPAHVQARPAPGRHAGPSTEGPSRTPTNHAEAPLLASTSPLSSSPLPAVVPVREKPPMLLRQTPGHAQCARAEKEGGERRPRCTHALVVPPHVAALLIRGQIPVPAHELIEELGGRYHRELRTESPSPDTSSAASPQPPAPRLTETKWRRWLALPTMHRVGRAAVLRSLTAPPCRPARAAAAYAGSNGKSRQIPERGTITAACGPVRWNGKPCPAQRAVMTDNIQLPGMSL